MELLKCRTEFEEITNVYKLESGSDINKLEWFVENGHRSNSLRHDFNYAKQLAEKIISEDNEWQMKLKQLMLQQSKEQI